MNNEIANLVKEITEAQNVIREKGAALQRALGLADTPMPMISLARRARPAIVVSATRRARPTPKERKAEVMEYLTANPGMHPLTEITVGIRRGWADTTKALDGLHRSKQVEKGWQGSTVVWRAIAKPAAPKKSKKKPTNLKEWGAAHTAVIETVRKALTTVPITAPTLALRLKIDKTYARKAAQYLTERGEAKMAMLRAGVRDWPHYSK